SDMGDVSTGAVQCLTYHGVRHLLLFMLLGHQSMGVGERERNGIDAGSGALCRQDALPGYSVGGYPCGPWFRLRRLRGGPRRGYRRGIADRAEPRAPNGRKGRIHGFGNWTQGPGTEGGL